MNKEMLDKLNELLKKNGRRELNLDEVDKVVGGYTSEMMNSLLDDPEGVRSFVYDFIAPIEAAYGRDVVMTILNEMFHNTDITDDYKGAGLAGLYNVLGLKCIDHAYTNYDGNLFW